MTLPSKSRALIAVLAPLLLIIACSKAKPRQYSELGQKGATGAHTEENCPVHANEPMGELKWTTPTGWKIKAATGMRLASFQTGNDLDCSLIPLSGEVGGIPANIRRWLDQMSVNIDAKDLERLCQGVPKSTSKAGIPYQVVDLTPYTGASGESIIVSVSTFSDVMLFIKLKGEKAKVLADRKAFLSLCDSLSR